MRISDLSSDVCSSDLPLAQDRPAADGIARERELLEPLRRWAEHVVDTTSLSSNALQQEIRSRFSLGKVTEPTLTILSFGFARGLPRNADLEIGRAHV